MLFISVSPLKKLKKLDLKLHLFQAANNYSFNLKELIRGTPNLKKALSSHLNSPTFFFFGLENACSAGSDMSGGTCRGQKEANTLMKKRDSSMKSSYSDRVHHHTCCVGALSAIFASLASACPLWLCCLSSPVALAVTLAVAVRYRRHLQERMEDEIFLNTLCVLWSCEMPQGIFQTNPNRPWDETSDSSAGGRSSSDDLRFLLWVLPCEMTAAYRFCRSPWKFRTSSPSEHSRGRVWGWEEERDGRIKERNFIQYPKWIKSEIRRIPPKNIFVFWKNKFSKEKSSKFLLKR